MDSYSGLVAPLALPRIILTVIQCSYIPVFRDKHITVNLHTPKSYMRLKYCREMI